MSRESEAFCNTGAGIDQGKTWVTPVRIRERESNRVELVLGAEGGQAEGQGPLRIEKKYH